MRVVVCGGRDYADELHVWTVLDALHAWRPITYLAEGGAEGADLFARRWAKIRGIASTATFRADWHRHRRAAGPIRNGEMLRVGNPDMVIAFPGGRGTADMVRQARAAGVPVREIEGRSTGRGRGQERGHG